MKNAIKIYVLLFYILCLGNSEASAHKSENRTLDTTKFSALKIGDTVPDFILKNQLNFPPGVHRLSDLKGKLIILDFWETGCTSCIKSFPHMEELQKEFPNELVVLAINTSETLDEANKTFKVMKEINSWTRFPLLPTIIGDKSWANMFPHHFEPFNVWIGKDGRVLSLTDGYNATRTHVAGILSGKSVPMIQRNDVLVNYNYWHKPLLKPAIDQIPSAICYSAFFAYQSGIAGMGFTTTDSVNHTFRICFGANDIYSLYRNAYPEYKNKILLKVPDISDYQQPLDPAKLSDDWLIKNEFTYELTIPLKNKDKWTNYMQQDLNRFVNTDRKAHGVIEKAAVYCWVLKLKDKRLLKGKQDTSDFAGSYERVGTMFNFNGSKISNLLAFLSKLQTDFRKPFIILNETGLKNQVFNFTVPMDEVIVNQMRNVVNVNLIKSCLLKSGFELSYVKRNVKVLAIKPVK